MVLGKHANTPVPPTAFSVSLCLCGLIGIFQQPLSLILFVADLFHPVDGLAVKVFQNGDVRHRRASSGSVPILLTRRAPDHIARPNFLFRATLALHPPTSGCDYQGLAERA